LVIKNEIPSIELSLFELLASRVEGNSANLIGRCRQSLQKDLFSNRTDLRPKAILNIAGRSPETLIRYFRDTTDAAYAFGEELNNVGLSSQSVFGVCRAYWEFTRDILVADSEITGLILEFLGEVVRGYFERSEKNILKQQESFRLAFQIAINRTTTEKEEAMLLAQKATESSYRNIIMAQEEERRRISRELHDEAGQALIGIRMSLSNLLTELNSDPVDRSQQLENAIQMTDTALTEIRNLAYSLRPPVLDLLGLHLTLKQLCLDYARQSGLIIKYSGTELPRLKDELAISVYRIVQEAFTNIYKHAYAKRVWVKLGSDQNQISLTIKDDGQGFNPETTPFGIGLMSMQERMRLVNGVMEIKSAEGKPTQLIFQVPVVLKSGEMSSKQPGT
jgi:signal transduction histidine kinase